MKVQSDKLYTFEELSQELGLSVRTLQRYAADGSLPVRRVGKRVFVLGSDLLTSLPVGAAPEAKPKRRRKPKPKPATYDTEGA